MTLRHYGRALAAATGAALLCATLAAPSLAAPSSDTGDAAVATASATDEGSAPISVTATRTDDVGDTLYVGDVVTVTFTYTNNTDSALTVFPVESNLSGVLTTGAPQLPLAQPRRAHHEVLHERHAHRDRRGRRGRLLRPLRDLGGDPRPQRHRRHRR